MTNTENNATAPKKSKRGSRVTAPKTGEENPIISFEQSKQLKYAPPGVQETIDTAAKFAFEYHPDYDTMWEEMIEFMVLDQVFWCESFPEKRDRYWCFWKAVRELMDCCYFHQKNLEAMDSEEVELFYLV